MSESVREYLSTEQRSQLTDEELDALEELYSQYTEGESANDSTSVDSELRNDSASVG